VSFLSFSFFPVLGIEPRATCVLGKHSTTWAMPRPCFLFLGQGFAV
jgi:hypothetical protein